MSHLPRFCTTPPHAIPINTECAPHNVQAKCGSGRQTAPANCRDSHHDASVCVTVSEWRMQLIPPDYRKVWEKSEGKLPTTSTACKLRNIRPPPQIGPRGARLKRTAMSGMTSSREPGSSNGQSDPVYPFVAFPRLCYLPSPYAAQVRSSRADGLRCTGLLPSTPTDLHAGTDIRRRHATGRTRRSL